MLGRSQPRTGLSVVRVRGSQPEVLAALADGFAPEELGEPETET